MADSTRAWVAGALVLFSPVSILRSSTLSGCKPFLGTPTKGVQMGVYFRGYPLGKPLSNRFDTEVQPEDVQQVEPSKTSPLGPVTKSIVKLAWLTNRMIPTIAVAQPLTAYGRCAHRRCPRCCPAVTPRPSCLRLATPLRVVATRNPQETCHRRPRKAAKFDCAL